MIDLSKILEKKDTTLTIFFASQCTPLDNNSKIPQNQIYITITKLPSVKFENRDIIKACVRYFYQIFIFSPNDNPSKIMKNAFYFI